MNGFTIPAASNKSGFPWPVGLYLAELASVSEEEQVSQFGDTPRARFEFRVLRVIDSDDPAEAQRLMADSRTVNGWCNVTMGKRATMRLWVEAIMGRELAEGEQPTIDDLTVRKCRLTVAEYVKQDGTRAVKLTSISAYNKPAAAVTGGRPATRPVADDDDGNEAPF